MSERAPRDDTERLVAAVHDAVATGGTLDVRGGGSKAFLGYRVAGEAHPLDVTTHSGVLLYEPGELVLRARGGTALREVEELLASEGQALPFEPPAYGGNATLGGVVAAGLSGPARPWRGAVRDALLGARVINGLGEVLSFGGQVMKNVAGYDLTRLMAGSMGTLAILLDVSIRLVPVGEAQQTMVRECDAGEALDTMRTLAASSMPISATCHDGERIYVRLTGTGRGVDAAAQSIGGERLAEDSAWWRSIREHEHPFFSQQGDLWRVVTAPDGVVETPGEPLIEWNGTLRWTKVEAGVDLRARHGVECAESATLFRRGASDASPGGVTRTQPLPHAIADLHTRLKHSFDPHGVFNRGRMSGEW